MQYRLPFIVGVDMDGTLCENAYPDIGAPKVSRIDGRTIIEKLIEKQRDEGWFLCLWTCRHGEKLQEAVEWCKSHGLTFNAINAGHPRADEAFGFPRAYIEKHKDEISPKPFFNLTLDDRVMNVEDF